MAGRVRVMQNGVDSEHFSPDVRLDDPYPAEGPNIAFTGAMDYWPNVDAVGWFVAEILPLIRRQVAGATFWIVGRDPAPAVKSLAGEGVVVTGAVPDVRPYVAHADVVVAPLRIARGIQNKVLEAMAMAKPVVLSQAPAVGLGAEPGVHCEVAGNAGLFADRVVALLQDPGRRERMGAAARQRVVEAYSWEAHLAVLERLLEG
jgi:sugar transferase (PEP-CTERM/EpsH1 system associated)